MKNTTSVLKILALVTGLLVATACNPIEKSAKSNSMLIIDSIKGTLSDGTTVALILESDVSAVKSDVATVTMHAALLDPGSINGPSQYNDITLTGYRINYTLPDGTGVAGTDVPNPLTGTASSLLVKVDASVAIDLIAVLQAAKSAAPLAALVGTANQLQILAKITMQGQDATGHTVEATGQLTIIFADY